MIRIVLAALTLGVAGAAAAQDTVIQEPDHVVVRARTIVDFGEVLLDGDLARPEGSLMVRAPRPDFPGLMKVRADFLPELQRSADRL